MMKVFGDSISGNCLKVKYTADYLGLEYEWQEIDLLAGDTRTDEFLAMSPAGQVPLVQLQDGRILSQSNAIISFLAEESLLLPQDPYQRALVNQWLFWEQYSHEPYIAVLRFQMKYVGKTKNEREAWCVDNGEMALDLMEQHLTDKTWFVGEAFSIADIALFAYTSMAEEGGFVLGQRAVLGRWLSDCRTALNLAA